MTNKLIPKIDHSGVDPGYYEYNLNEIKSNKDLMKREYSKATEFAKEFVKTKKEELASKKGLKVIRLWESDIKKDPSIVIRTLNSNIYRMR